MQFLQSTRLFFHLNVEFLSMNGWTMNVKESDDKSKIKFIFLFIRISSWSFTFIYGDKDEICWGDLIISGAPRRSRSHPEGWQQDLLRREAKSSQCAMTNSAIVQYGYFHLFVIWIWSNGFLLEFWSWTCSKHFCKPDKVPIVPWVGWVQQLFSILS